MKVELNQEQLELRRVIEENLAITKNFRNERQDDLDAAYTKMKDAAHKLHMQLNPKPKHHRYMIENRNLQSDHPDFYDHIHPVEDLLSYLEDTTANDDPIDHTMGASFEMKLYTNRWGHYDLYQLTRTKEGWYSEFQSYKGEDSVNEFGMKTLFTAMEHDSISYPRDVDYYFRGIWNRARDEGLTHEEVQKMIDRVASWISDTERNAPTDLLN